MAFKLSHQFRLLSLVRGLRRVAVISGLAIALACSKSGGGSGQAASAGSELGLFPLNGAGLGAATAELTLAPKNARPVSVALMLGGEPERDVTANVVWTSSDPSVAVANRGEISAHDAGTAELTARVDSDSLVVRVRVLEDDDARVLALDFAPETARVLSGVAPLELRAVAQLENGSVAVANDRLLWSAEPSRVASVDPRGILEPRASGALRVEVRDPASGLSAQLDLQISLPQPNSSVISSAAGGLIASGEASVRIPPDALAADAQVTLAQPLSAAELPAPLLANDAPLFLGAVSVDLAPHQAIQGAVELRAPCSAACAPGDLVDVRLLDSSTGVWEHHAWGLVAPDGRSFSFPASHLSDFVGLQAAVSLDELARIFAPHFIVSLDDVHPVSLEAFLAQTEVESDGKPSPSVGDLFVGYWRENAAVALLPGVHGVFTSGESWGLAALGGMGRREEAGHPPATVYFALQHATPGRLVLQYWSLYAASGLPRRVFGLPDRPTYWHEGDLEMVQVILADDGGLRPVAVTASQHLYGEGRHWNDVEHADSSHPVVYVAEWSHAPYLAPGFDRAFRTFNTGFGNQGFDTKADVSLSLDVTPIVNSESTLTPGVGAGHYELRSLHDGSVATQVLVEWPGHLGHLVPGLWDLNRSGPRAIGYRNPQDADLLMFRFPLSFHEAYDWSTETSIEAIKLARPGRDVSEQGTFGQRMVELQDYYADELEPQCGLNEGAVESPVQRAIDAVSCGEPQPRYLANYLSDTARGRPPRSPADYFAACPTLTAEILTPEDGARFDVDSAVNFRAQVVDARCGGVPEVLWLSDLDGPFASGVEAQTGSLSVGRHQITLRARNSAGAVVERSVAVEIQAAPPPPPPPPPPDPDPDPTPSPGCELVTDGDYFLTIVNRNGPLVVFFEDFAFEAHMNADACEIFGMPQRAGCHTVLFSRDETGGGAGGVEVLVCPVDDPFRDPAPTLPRLSGSGQGISSVQPVSSLIVRQAPATTCARLNAGSTSSLVPRSVSLCVP